MMGRRQRTHCDEEEWLNRRWRRVVFRNHRAGAGRHIKRRLNKRWRRETRARLREIDDETGQADDVGFRALSALPARPGGAG